MQKLNLVGLFLVLSILIGCGGEHMTTQNTSSTPQILPEPEISEVTSAPAASPSPAEEKLSYEKDIKPKYFATVCIGCHNQNSPAMMPNWMDYDTAYAKRDRIYDRVVVKKDMPMGGSLRDDQREEIGKWVKQGALR